MNLRCLTALLALAIAGTASAFDVDGFRTGMTVSEVATVVQAQGWSLVPNSLTPGLYMEAHLGRDHKASELGPANFTFCDGRLVAYTRQLDFDTEYAMKLQQMIGTYGNHPQIKVDHSTWSGPGGGYITQVNTLWKVGRERAEIVFAPEERVGGGSLKHLQSADVSYYATGVCPKQ